VFHYVIPTCYFQLVNDLDRHEDVRISNAKISDDIFEESGIGAGLQSQVVIERRKEFSK
jgi:hypothetical protein